MGKRSVLVGLLVASLVASGCSGEAEGKASKEGAKAAPRPAAVRLAPARAGELTVAQTYLAEVEPRLEAALSSGASGEVLTVDAREGERVERGDVLLTVDTALVRAELSQAEAARAQLVEQREQALREAERIEGLGPEVAPQIEAERERSRARALEASIASQDAVIRRARAQRGRHRVVAPFAGVVARRRVDPGDWVNVGAPVVELVDAAGVEVFVPVPARLAAQIEPGHAVTLRGRAESAPGEVVGVVPAVEPTTRTIRLRVMPTAPTPWLIPGDAVDATIEVTTKEPGGVVVPRDAVVAGVAGDRVFVVGPDGNALKVDVVVVMGDADEALLAPNEALSSGTEVVVRGNERLRPGQPVKVEVAPAGEVAP
jgi:RND family efflux transporter MFP subunit